MRSHFTVVVGCPSVEVACLKVSVCNELFRVNGYRDRSVVKSKNDDQDNHERDMAVSEPSEQREPAVFLESEPL